MPALNKPRKAILVLGISKHLSGVPIAKVIATDWAKEKGNGIRDSFENVGFDPDPNNVTSTLATLKEILEGRNWDGVILGWCVRGHVEFTDFFEDLVRLVVNSGQKNLMFSTGQDNLVETVVRNYPRDVSKSLE